MAFLICCCICGVLRSGLGFSSNLNFASQHWPLMKTHCRGTLRQFSRVTRRVDAIDAGSVQLCQLERNNLFILIDKYDVQSFCFVNRVQRKLSLTIRFDKHLLLAHVLHVDGAVYNVLGCWAVVLHLTLVTLDLKGVSCKRIKQRRMVKEEKDDFFSPGSGCTQGVAMIGIIIFWCALGKGIEPGFSHPFWYSFWLCRIMYCFSAFPMHGC